MQAVFAVIFLPFIGAFLVGVTPKRFKPALSVSLLGLTFFASLFALPIAVKYKEIISQAYINPWFSFSFIADGLSVFMCAVSSFVAFLISLYSLEYMEHYEERGDFYFWMTLFAGAMMGLVFSANLLLMYCFWEITAVCSWKLIGFWRKDKDIKAADRAFLTTFFGASLMLLGIVAVYTTCGTLEVYLLKGRGLVDAVAFLLLAGILSKSAQLPFQTWLPDAGVAPTPVTALLHAAVLVKIGVYVFARFFSLTFTTTPFFMNTAIAIAAMTIIVGACSAMLENNLKRLLAYSTISQLGYVILAFSLNSAVSFRIGMLYILAHSLAKAGLFLCAGIIEQKTGTKDITQLGGLIKGMPYTALAYSLCAFAIIGIPPFLGFWPKFMVVLLTLKGGHLLAGILAVAGALMTLFYLMRFFDKVFLGEVKIKAEEGQNSPMVYVVLALGGLSLLLGLAARPILDFIYTATAR